MKIYVRQWYNRQPLHHDHCTQIERMPSLNADQIISSIRKEIISQKLKSFIFAEENDQNNKNDEHTVIRNC